MPERVVCGKLRAKELRVTMLCAARVVCVWQGLRVKYLCVKELCMTRVVCARLVRESVVP